MSPKKACGRDRTGSALVITMLVLVAVGVLGIMSINTSVVELFISRNEREIRESFYLAEGGVMEGTQRLMDLPAEDLEEQFAFWHHSQKEIEADHIDFRNPDDWDFDGDGDDNALACALAQETYAAAVEWRVATGGSLIQTESRLYQNRIYGLCRRFNTGNLIEIGYYLRY